MSPRFGTPNEFSPFADQVLALPIPGMRLARQDQLDRTIGAGQQPQQPLGIMKQEIRPLVAREPACKAERQRLGVKQFLRVLDCFGRLAGDGQLP